jgi:histidinol-phosphate/aromatic aminotransferase/cobyric acid decarboxylase-like protein
MIREALSQTSMPAVPAVFTPQPSRPILELHVSTEVPDDSCYHGGAFFEAIGDGFETLYRRERIIAADVLDAWFRPSPAVLTTLRAHLDWIVRTSPPTNGNGLVRAIARSRGVPATSVVVGGGSSDLIHLAFTQWLRPESRVLVLDPMYGEYAHVLEQVVGCHVDRLTLCREQQYRVDMAELELAMRRGYDLVVLVNPNSPTGQHVPARALAEIVARAPAATRVWIDETYVEYAGPDESLESLAAVSDRLVICKSMSKVYALSGVRVAYLVTGAESARALRRRTPPWAVGLPGQIAAVKALESRTHYRRYWTLTHRLRASLARELEAITGVEVIPGIANFLLVHLTSCLPDAATVVARCRAEGLYLRDAGLMCPSLGDRAIRITVRDRMTNQRLLEIFRRALGVC